MLGGNEGEKEGDGREGRREGGCWEGRREIGRVLGGEEGERDEGTKGGRSNEQLFIPLMEYLQHQTESSACTTYVGGTTLYQ